MIYTVRHRPAECGPETPWAPVAEARTLAGVADELASWQGPRPHHGDLAVATHPSFHQRLYVFDAERGSFLRAPRVPKQVSARTWDAYWDGPLASAELMLLHGCDRVERRRVIMAGCACARLAWKLAAQEHDAPLRALGMVEAWARGETPHADLYDAYESANEFYNSGPPDRAQERAADATRLACWGAANIVDCVPAASCSAAIAMQEIGAYAPVATEVRRFVLLSSALCASMGLKEPARSLGPATALRVVNAPTYTQPMLGRRPDRRELRGGAVG